MEGNAFVPAKLTLKAAIRSGAFVLLASGVSAQERSALVVANSGYDGALALPEVRETALEMSEALFGLGFTVSRLENPGTDALRDALAELQAGGGPVVIYYAGHGFSHDGDSYLRPVGVEGDTAETLAPGSFPLSDLLAASGTSETMVFLDTCHGPASQMMPGQGALDRSFAETATGIFNLLTITSVQPGLPCPADADAVPSLTPFLLERLPVPGLPSNELLTDVPDLPPILTPDATEEEIAAAEAAPPPAPGIWAASTLTTPFVFRTATSDARLTAKDYETLESLSPAARDQMLALWASAGIAVDFAGGGDTASAPSTMQVVTDETVVLTAPVQPVEGVQTVAPMSVSSVATVNDGISIFNADPAPTPALASRPVPGAGGLPMPSVIVGLPEVEVEASFDAAPETTGPIAGAELSYDNLEARRSLRAENETLFLSLVEGGAFDPPTQELARVLQTELSRMGCYRSGIDGIWGNGSRASVQRYYDEIGEAVPSQDPDVRIFRQIVMRDDVECPAPAPQPVAQAPQRQSSGSNTARQPTRQTQSAPARQAPAPAPQQQQPQRRTLSNSSGTGIFR